jgi:hypothetical protein
MGARIRNLTGLEVGRLTVLRFSHVNQRREAVWVCRCACTGRLTEIAGRHLTSRLPTRSCGCLRSDWREERSASSVKTVIHFYRPAYA